MSDDRDHRGPGETWESANGDFLAASLTWLRAILRRELEQPTGPEASDQAMGAARGDGRTAGPSHEETQASAAAEGGAAADDVASAAEAVRRAEASNPPPALVTLASTFGLSRFERDTLLLCAAAELDPAMGRRFAEAQGNPSMTYPTLALALNVLPDPRWSIVSPQGALRFWRLVEITRHPGQPLTASAVRADERIVNAIKGLAYLDDRLDALCSRLDSGQPASLPGSQEEQVGDVTELWEAPDQHTHVVQLVGPDESSKALVASRAAGRCGLVAYRLPAAALPQDPTDLEHLARLWQREMLLLPLALYVDVEDANPTTEANTPPIRHFLSRVRGPILLSARDSWPDLEVGSTVIEVGPPTPSERAAVWREVLGARAVDVDIELLSGQFALGVEAIEGIARSTKEPADVRTACRVRTRPRLDALAQRLHPQVGWDDLVLPAPQLALLREVAGQVANRDTVYDGWGFGERITRGLGISALFAGISGGGKTLAAEVLANDLDLDLYRVDLSAVVSKYIGETEKNLRRLFDAAESGSVILFFDEADALFGKRTEVKDSHDRYANIESSYLLQRMEAYGGLSILATNMRNSLDAAFMRRIRFVVEFPFPGQEERMLIWTKAFPQGAPTQNLDFERLAELRLTGGMARNIALNAAFLAAAAREDISMTTVMSAARTEFQKLELPVRAQDFALDTGVVR